MSPMEYAIITMVLDDDYIDTGNNVANAWMRFNRDFRNELVWFRAKHANKDPLKFTRGVKENNPRLREVIQQAAKMSDLMGAEKVLDWARWQFLDDLASGHYHDFESIIVYGLKLKILERYQEYRSPKGKQIFDDMRTVECSKDLLVEATAR